MTAWALLVSFGMEKQLGIVVLLGGCTLLVAAYEVTRGGSVLGPLVCTGLSLERKLGLVPPLSMITGVILGFRRPQYLAELGELAECRSEAELAARLGHSYRYSLFHHKRSFMLLVLGMGGVLHVGLALYLMIWRGW